MSSHSTEQTSRTTPANEWSRLPVQQQHKRAQQKWEAIKDAVDAAYDSLKDTGETFGQNELYPFLPLVAINLVCTSFGFMPPAGVVESNVMTEALFQRLPSVGIIGGALSSEIRERELAGVGGR